jgi:hypothetical protein
MIPVLANMVDIIFAAGCLRTRRRAQQARHTRETTNEEQALVFLTDRLKSGPAITTLELSHHFAALLFGGSRGLV